MADVGSKPDIARFAQLQSQVDVTFMAELCDHKLDVLKLSEAPVELVGFLSPNRHEHVPPRLSLDVSSLRPGVTSRQSCHAVPGQLLLYNTVEGFKGADKHALMRQTAGRIWSDIVSGAAEAQPALLLRFLLLAYGDLKRYDFQYWFAFPALKPPSAFTLLDPAARLAEALPPEAVQQVADACAAWLNSSAPSASAPSAAPLQPHDDAAAPAAAAPDAAAAPHARPIPATHAEAVALSPPPFWLLASPDPSFATHVRAHPLADWQQLQSPGEGRPHVMLACSDTSNSDAHPGWQLRNALLLAAVRWGVPALRVLCVREQSRGGGRLDAARCLLLRVGLPAVPQGWPAAAAAGVGAAGSAAGGQGDGGACPEAVGWEPNEQGKLLPRFVSLSAHLSPGAQAEQAVDLNLRLMRWRAAPELDVGGLARTKCLLLGAGTLGCAVARTLQAWGVRHITLLDSSRVAFSNPVRQSLYNHEDCLGGGRPKAEAAAEALRRIFPSAVTRGLALSIPMPGHPPAGPAEEQQQQEAVAQLDALVAAHDVVFLLTDTRESRWLPALLAAAHGKLAITAAVGFDSFLVMRHGAPPGAANAPDAAPRSTAAGSGTSAAGGTAGADAADAAAAGSTSSAAAAAAAHGSACGSGAPAPAPAPGRRLGCYFCNDVVAPANSTRDRSLDQQCTVARPGLAPMAGALAAELVAAVVQQREGVCAPPPSVQQQQGGALPPLGSAPHMIRGGLSSWSQVLMEGWAFSQCTACSEAVVAAYRERGWGLVRMALDSPAHLEALTGLSELHAAAAKMMESDEEGEGEGEDGGGKGEGSGVGGGGEEAGEGGVGGRQAGGDGGGEGGGEEEGEGDDDWTEL